MVERLFEDYGNLNRLDPSFFSNNVKNSYKLNFSHRTSLDRGDISNSFFTPNCKIEQDKVTPHNFTQVMNIYKRDDVLGIVVRAHGRQLGLLSKSPEHSNSDEWNIHYSSFARIHLNVNSTYLQTRSEAKAKSELSGIVRRFYSMYAPTGTKQKWDILIIYKDPTKALKRQSRYDEKQGMVKTPHDKGYNEYIKSLKRDFRDRAIEYLDKVMKDCHSQEEIMNFFQSKHGIRKIKFFGAIYNKESDFIGSYNRDFNMTWDASEPDVSANGVLENQPTSIRMNFRFDRLQIVLQGILVYLPSKEWVNLEDFQPVFKNSTNR